MLTIFYQVAVSNNDHFGVNRTWYFQIICEHRHEL